MSRLLAFRDLIWSSPQVAAREEGRESTSPSTLPSHLVLCDGCELNCRQCKRILIPGEVYANGFDDGPSLCSRCKQVKMETESGKRGVWGWDRESTENYR